MIELKVEKMYDDVILPKYQQCGDAGFDIHSYLYDDETGEKLNKVIIPPQGTYKIHTGLKTEFPSGFYLELVPRGSAGIKKTLRLMNTFGIVDSAYRSEILIFVHNFGLESVEIINGERLIQGMIKKVEEVKIIQVDKVSETKRGSGFGSSGAL